QKIEFSDHSACCVIVASKGYPVKYETGFKVQLPKIPNDTNVYFAGIKKSNEQLLSNGGRVLGVTSVCKTLDSAIKKAYDYTSKIQFENGFFRHDIGKKALNIIAKGEK
ncbi:MAG: phosphoribosylglycinamide synthetase C domain-containing protein, partial [Clostridia bacterium]